MLTEIFKLVPACLLATVLVTTTALGFAGSPESHGSGDVNGEPAGWGGGSTSGPSPSSPAGGAQAAGGYSDGSRDAGESDSSNSYDGASEPPSPSSPAGGAQAAGGYGDGSRSTPPSYESVTTFDPGRAIFDSALSNRNDAPSRMAVDPASVAANIAARANQTSIVGIPSWALNPGTYKDEKDLGYSSFSSKPNEVTNAPTQNNTTKGASIPTNTLPSNSGLAEAQQHVAQNREALAAARTMSDDYRDIVVAGIEANLAAAESKVAAIEAAEKAAKSGTDIDAMFASSAALDATIAREAATLATAYANAGDIHSAKAASEEARSAAALASISASDEEFSDPYSSMLEAAEKQASSYREALHNATTLEDENTREVVTAGITASLAAAQAQVAAITARMNTYDAMTYSLANKTEEYSNLAQEAARQAVTAANNGQIAEATEAQAKALEYNQLAQQTLTADPYDIMASDFEEALESQRPSRSITDQLNDVTIEVTNSARTLAFGTTLEKAKWAADQVERATGVSIEDAFATLAVNFGWDVGSVSSEAF